MTDENLTHRIRFVSLSEGSLEGALIDLMNMPKVHRYLPLMTGPFTQADYRDFVTAKQAMWNQVGYGPHAFVIDGQFAGWGGLQPENGEADFALVLHPDFWGWGKRLFKAVVAQAVQDNVLTSLTVLLPIERHNKNALVRFGFKEEGKVDITGKSFVKYRLYLS
ncbi:GNAT family N-acetyltransferase [Terasakiella pusilla]|uniref:GNAT family N-acetyltransferase n=1 Tax=Terasakiella pusilla TaxID=64973 RepID=UPI003AA912C7